MSFNSHGIIRKRRVVYEDRVIKYLKQFISIRKPCSDKSSLIKEENSSKSSERYKKV